MDMFYEYLLIGGMGIAHEKGLSGHQHAGGAEAALYGAVLNKHLLENIQLSVLPQAFHGEKVSPVQLAGHGEAGVDGIAVQDDGAGTAFTDAAAFLGTGEVKALPDKIQNLQHLCLA